MYAKSVVHQCPKGQRNYFIYRNSFWNEQQTPCLLWVLERCVCRRVMFRHCLKLQFCHRETELLLFRSPCSLDLPAPGGHQRGSWKSEAWVDDTIGRALLKGCEDVTITGHSRSIFAQYSVSDVAMGSFLQNVKNRLSKCDSSLNTVLRLEFPRQDVLYFYFGNFLVKLLQILVQSPSLNTCTFLQLHHQATCSADLLICFFEQIYSVQLGSW